MDDLYEATLLTLCEQLHSRARQETDETFKLLDINGDGSIDFEEMLEVLGQDWNEEEIERER